MLCDQVRDEQVEVVELEGEGRFRPERANRHPALARVVAGDRVAVGVGVVDLALGGIGDDVAGLAKTEIDRRLSDLRRAMARDGRHSCDVEHGVPTALLVRRRQHRTVAVGVLQVDVDPGRGWQVCRIDLAHADHKGAECELIL